VLCTAAPEHKYYFVDGDVQYEYEPDVYPSYANTFGDVVTPQAPRTKKNKQILWNPTLKPIPLQNPKEEDTDHPSNDDPPET